VSLVASAEPGESGLDFYKCIAIIGPAVTTAVDVANGEPLGALVSLASAGVDVAAAILDPIAALASSVASIMLTYIPMLRDDLDILVGNPGAVAGFAQTWRNIEGRLESCQADLLSFADDVLGNWTGTAANTYRESVTAFGQVMTDVAHIAGGVGAGLKLASEIIGVIRQIVVQLVSDLVGAMISAFIEAGITLGTGTPAIIAQLVGKITKYAKEAKEWTTGLSAAGTKLAKDVDRINTVIHSVIPELKAAEHKLVYISLGHLVEDAYEFMTEASKAGESEPEGVPA
jgi:uncharacterized protein YukE